MAQYISDRETVTQLGTVRSIHNGYADVALQAASACVSCSVAGSCSHGGGDTRRTVRIPLGPDYNPGDRIQVTLEARHGLLAVLLMFGVPLIVLMGVILWATSQGWSDAMAAGAALGAVGLYGLILWLLNDKIQQNLPVHVEKLSFFPEICLKD